MTKLTSEMSPQELAQAAAAAMWSRDYAAQSLGMKIESVRPGYALLTMKINNSMVNGHHICHGGFVFTLADTAFAYACNSYNVNNVASGCNIEFLRPSLEGETLTAEAQERSLGRRSGVYDVTVTNPAGKIVAFFRGKSARIDGEVIAGLEQE